MSPNREPWWRKLLRRSVTIPVYVILFALSTVLAPAIFAVSLTTDLARRNRLALSRALAMAYVYLLAEMLGLARATWFWLRRRSMTGEQWERAHMDLEGWWADFQFHAAVRIFGLKLEVDGEEHLKTGPYLLFIRHVSVVDNLIPAVFAVRRQGINLRWVLNRSLLRDPCIDVVGLRMPFCFVKGSTQDSDREIGRMRAIVRDVTTGEGLIAFPEGTLFSPNKRDRVIRKLRSSGDMPLLAAAERFQHVLPPRLGGTLAVLQERPDLDVVFCSHQGLEDSLTKASIASGGLIGRPLHISFWREPAATRPRDTDELRRWLFEQWDRVDEFAGRSFA
jgi:1-acyl-sn-glycerol-3-phosphate acyltransferase